MHLPLWVNAMCSSCPLAAGVGLAYGEDGTPPFRSATKCTNLCAHAAVMQEQMCRSGSPQHVSPCHQSCFSGGIDNHSSRVSRIKPTANRLIAASGGSWELRQSGSLADVDVSAYCWTKRSQVVAPTILLHLGP